jgi:hypothetical protein
MSSGGGRSPGRAASDGSGPAGPGLVDRLEGPWALGATRTESCDAICPEPGASSSSTLPEPGLDLAGREFGDSRYRRRDSAY